ncbi:MAG: LysM peptidoglycan-binding domain-containing protein [Rhizobiaceae bacterium]|nr:LysM peptidoglycan-binding domain-containing protein [Rhizobiaceae bacterium]MCV0408082.1 LysM peptidoglycan-binding domain-containing protein [Rhizobiaceae bacterium]
MSAETAIVSVPDSPDGDVLALVEAPGEASRLITTPRARTEGGAQQAGTEAEPAAEGAGDAADVADAADPVVEAPIARDDGRDDGASSQTADADASEDGDVDDQVALSDPSATSRQDEQAEPSEGQRVEDASPQRDEAEETAAGGDDAAGERQAAVQPGDAGDRNESREAAGEPVAEEAAPARQPAPDKAAASQVAIQAVEIEGRRVFVAGEAEAGRIVRIYANEILLGQARASQAGRFLIEAERDMPVGDYIVRADMLADDQAAVLARAAVPFAREEGEFVAAVAPATRDAADEAAPAVDDAEASQPVPSRQEVAGRVDETVAGQVSADHAGSGEEPSPAPVLTPAPQGSVSIQPGEAAGASTDGERTAAPSSRDDAAPSRPVVSEEARPRSAPAGQEVAAATIPTEAPRSGETLSPRLEPVKSAVIIRRGDTLWRISRRVYGRGVRYSTIYLANQDQIADPDLIWPGQVFKVPVETDEGEKADLSTIGDQATTATERLQ